MATSNSLNYLLYASLLYLFLFFSNAQNNLSHHSIEVSNLLPSTSCKHSSKDAKNNATLKVVHKHGPCIQRQQYEKSPNISVILRKDQIRVNSIHTRLSRTSNGMQTKDTTVPAKIGLSLGIANYVVTIVLGTPKTNLPVIFDTGSDLTWAKCIPASSDYNLDPTQSTSYADVPCTDPLCSSKSYEGATLGCETSASTCEFYIQYGDQSTTDGFLGIEKLSIGTTETLDQFYFGCSQDSAEEFEGVAGLMGLGPSQLSIVSQTASQYNKLFSYCLPTETSTGFLSFGSSHSTSATFVPLVKTNPDESNVLYFLELTGITVGGSKLSIPTSVFTTVGTIIDSGTVISRLPSLAYSALQSTFQEMMSQYPMTNPRDELLDTCFDFSDVQVMNVPKIVLLFNEESDLEIPTDGIFFGDDLSQMCLAFAANDDPTSTGIIGNVQQRTLEDIYDVNGGRVGFATSGCT